MMTATKVIGQRERNHDLCGEIRIAKTVITRGDRERKSAKCVIKDNISKIKIVQKNV